MPRRAAVAAILGVAAVASSCGSGHHARSTGEVVRALRSAELRPRPVTITITLRGGSTSPVPLQAAIDSSGALGSAPAATYQVDHGRAIVTVYRTEDDAARYAPLLSPRFLRVRNVVAVAIRGRLSARLRATLKRLR